jgi:hypothetical protein
LTQIRGSGVTRFGDSLTQATKKQCFFVVFSDGYVAVENP